ncbi:MAG: phage tail protein [Chloroflexi bacterium]|nr:MAG: phage tail protein [Chloroflexota bacterium]
MSKSELIGGPSGPKGGMERKFGIGMVGKMAAKNLAGRAAGAVGSTLGQIGLNALAKQMGVRYDPAPAYLFIVEMGGLPVGEFTECSGFELSREVIEHREGGRNNYVHKLPGPVTHSNLILARGVTVSSVLYDWFKAGIYTNYVRKLNISVTLGAPMQGLYTDGLVKVRHWNVEDAFPVRWKGPEMSTSSTETAIEEIELAYQTVTESYIEKSSPFNPFAMLVAGDL